MWASLFHHARVPTAPVPAALGSDIFVMGTVRTDTALELRGEVRGDVHARAVIVCKGAAVEGDIVADEVTVRGRVKGLINARKVRLKRTAHVRGDIQHQEPLDISYGADFVGSAKRSYGASAPAPLAA